MVAQFNFDTFLRTVIHLDCEHFGGKHDILGYGVVILHCCCNFRYFLRNMVGLLNINSQITDSDPQISDEVV